MKIKFTYKAALKTNMNMKTLTNSSNVSPRVFNQTWQISSTIK